VKKSLGFAMCGSFCTHKAALEVMKNLSLEYNITPILSFTAASTDTRFGTASMLKEMVRGICKREAVVTIEEAERFGPAQPLDYMLICPCTGNTMAKLANGVTDTPVTMAAKAHLRCDRPLLIALASNDALSGNFCNIGKLMQRKNVYFVPMKQDDIVSKPHSLVADFSLCEESLLDMEMGTQHRPLFTY